MPMPGWVGVGWERRESGCFVKKNQTETLETAGKKREEARTAEKGGESLFKHLYVNTPQMEHAWSTGRACMDEKRGVWVQGKDDQKTIVKKRREGRRGGGDWSPPSRAVAPPSLSHRRPRGRTLLTGASPSTLPSGGSDDDAAAAPTTPAAPTLAPTPPPDAAAAGDAAARRVSLLARGLSRLSPASDTSPPSDSEGKGVDAAAVAVAATDANNAASLLDATADAAFGPALPLPSLGNVLGLAPVKSVRPRGWRFSTRCLPVFYPNSQNNYSHFPEMSNAAPPLAPELMAESVWADNNSADACT